MNSSFVLETIKKFGMLENGDTVVIGLSGGADSVCLTSVLNSIKDDYKLTLVAAHINHGIRGAEAERDEQFCKDYCRRLGIRLEVLHADVPSLAKKNRQSEEECGRNVRYEFFNSIAGKNGKIATAHNLNDNAETVLLNITRGAGNKGVCGIPPVRDNIIRPLIETDRTDIEKYCYENGLNFVTDSTNLSNDYSRNKIRNEVLPCLREINPSVVNAISRLSRCACEDEEYLSSQSLKAYELCVNNNEIDEKVFGTLPQSIKKRVVAEYLNNNTDSDISSKHIDDMLQLVGSGSRLDTVGGLHFISRNGYVNLISEKPIDDWQIEVDKNDGEYQLPFGKVKVKLFNKKDLQNLNKQLLDNLIDCDKIGNTLILRNRRDGDKITLPKRNVTKSLKKLFNEVKIPVEKRNSVAVLCEGENVLWVDSIGTSKKYCVEEKTNTAILITVM